MHYINDIVIGASTFCSDAGSAFMALVGTEGWPALAAAADFVQMIPSMFEQSLSLHVQRTSKETCVIVNADINHLHSLTILCSVELHSHKFPSIPVAMLYSD